MKGQFLKKIAAVGTGLALVAGSVVAAVNWSDLVNTTDKTMNVSGIVIGSTADPMDSTAASALAAALANKYYEEKATEVTEQVPVEGTAGLSGEGSVEKQAIGANVIERRSIHLDSLIDETKSVVIDDSSKSLRMREYIFLNAESKYDTSKTVQELVAEYSKGNFGYKVTLGGTAGVDLETASYEADSVNYVILPFMGEWYELDNANGSTTIELVSEGNKDNWLNEGEEITGLMGKDGTTTYKVVISSAYTSDSNNYVILDLYNEATGKKVDTETVGTNETVTFRSQGKELLQESIKVKEIARRTVSSSDSFRVNIRTGLNRVVLVNNKCYPNYEETATSNKCDWMANVTFAGTALKEYGVSNVSKNTLTQNANSVLPKNYGAVEFLGFTEEDYSKVLVGAEMQGANGSDTGVVFTDDDDTLRYVPFYYNFEVGGLSDVNEIDYVDVEIDDQTWGVYFKVESDGNVSFFTEEGEADYDLAEAHSSWTSTDINALADASGLSATALTFELDNDLDVNYEIVMYNKGSGSYEVWLALSAQEFVAKDADVTFRGTYIADENIFEYYFLKENDFEEAIRDSTEYSDDGDEFFNALFDVNVSSDANAVRVFIDTEYGLLTDTSDSDNSQTAYAVAYGYLDENSDLVSSSATNLKTNKAGERTKYIATDGVEVSVVDDEYAQIMLPEDELEVKYRFYDSTGVTGEATYKTVTTTKMVDTPYAPMPFTPILDVEAGAGNYIVVGGYFVNDLFAEVAADAETAAEVFGEALAEAGDKVTKVINGSLYVAGYTKEDTMDAVNALIEELDL